MKIKTQKAATSKTYIWTDIQAYFIEFFEERPALEVWLTRGELISGMKARFGINYDTDKIADLLRNGFEVEPGVYLFKRDDFIKPQLQGDGYKVLEMEVEHA